MKKLINIIVVLFLVLSFYGCNIEDETERKKLINFIEHDYSRIRKLDRVKFSSQFRS